MEPVSIYVIKDTILRHDILISSEELESEKERLQKTESELKSVKEEYERLKGEMEGIKTAVAYSESNRQDEIEAIRRQCKEEIDTLQSLLNGQLQIYKERKLIVRIV